MIVLMLILNEHFIVRIKAETSLNTNANSANMNMRTSGICDSDESTIAICCRE
jgi:hypothetical protein